MSLVKRNFLTVIGLLSLLVFSFSTSPVGAAGALDGQIGLDQVSKSYGGQDANDVRDIRSIVAEIINVVSMFLGVIFVILIVVAGYLYMTSAGNEKQIEKSISYIKAGIIGLIIVLAAWSITTFVMGGGPNYKNGGLIKATDTRPL